MRKKILPAIFVLVIALSSILHAQKTTMNIVYNQPVFTDAARLQKN